MKRILQTILLTSILSGCAAGAGQDMAEYRDIAYSDVISPLVVGFSNHWSEFFPSDSGLSDVYCYESPYCAFAQTDIDGDGSPELLVGDCFEDGSYLLYDIFTFDVKSGSLMHLLSGGERDSYVINGSGIIIETGSSSAFDSFTKYYKIENAAIKEIEGPVTEDLMIPQFDMVLRYVAPSAYVAIDSEGFAVGQLVKTYEDSYLIEAQDTTRISKDGVDIQLWSAYDGKGVVSPNSPGEYPVYRSNLCDTDILGQAIYESGYVPETYPCKGYIPGWFKIDFGGTEAYVRTADFSWDFADRF